MVLLFKSNYEEVLSIYETVSWFLWWLQISCTNKRDPQWKDWYFYAVTINARDQIRIKLKQNDFFLNVVVLCNDSNLILFSAYSC